MVMGLETAFPARLKGCNKSVAWSVRNHTDALSNASWLLLAGGYVQHQPVTMGQTSKVATENSVPDPIQGRWFFREWGLYFLYSAGKFTAP